MEKTLNLLHCQEVCDYVSLVDLLCAISCHSLDTSLCRKGRSMWSHYFHHILHTVSLIYSAVQLVSCSAEEETQEEARVSIEGLGRMRELEEVRRMTCKKQVQAGELVKKKVLVEADWLLEAAVAVGQNHTNIREKMKGGREGGRDGRKDAEVSWLVTMSFRTCLLLAPRA